MQPASYDDAIQELQAIAQALQTNEISMDLLPEQLERAETLIRFCRERLRQVEARLDGLFENIAE